MNLLNILFGLPIRLLFYIPGWLWGHISAGFQMGFQGSRSYDERLQSSAKNVEEDTEPNPRAA